MVLCFFLSFSLFSFNVALFDKHSLISPQHVILLTKPLLRNCRFPAISIPCHSEVKPLGLGKNNFNWLTKFCNSHNRPICRFSPWGVSYQHYCFTPCKVCKNTGFRRPVYSRIRTESSIYRSEKILITKTSTCNRGVFKTHLTWSFLWK